MAQPVGNLMEAGKYKVDVTITLKVRPPIFIKLEHGCIFVIADNFTGRRVLEDKGWGSD